MKKPLLLALSIIFIGFQANSQNNVGIGTTSPNPNSLLDVYNSGQPLGVQLPRTDVSSGWALGAVDKGMFVFDTVIGAIMFWDGVTWQQPIVASGGFVTGSGTAGEVAYWTSSTNIQSNSNLFWDNANGRLGVGTNAPLTTLAVGNNKFRVNGDTGGVFFSDDAASIVYPVAGTGNSPMIYQFRSGTQNVGRMVLAHSPPFQNYGLKYEDSTDTYHFLGNGLPVLSIELASRMVGIGIKDPGHNLHVYNNGTVVARLQSNTGWAYLRLDKGSATSNNYINFRTGIADRWIIGDYNTGGSEDFRLIDWTNGAAGNYAIYVERGGINSVGLGTNTPVNRLDVEGGMAIGTNYSGSNSAPTDGLIVEGNVGIGSTGITAYRLHIEVPNTNTTTYYGIRNNNNYAGTQGKFGIYNWISTDGSSHRYGTYNNVNAAIGNTGQAYGTVNIVNHDGTGNVYSNYNSTGSSATSGNVWGTYNIGEDYNYFQGSVGVGTSIPVNKLDVEGGVAIGSSYSGSSAAPTDGLIVEGNSAIGITGSTPYRLRVYTPNTNSTTYYGIRVDNNYSGTTSKYGVYGGSSADGGGNKYGVYGYAAQPSGEASSAYGLYSSTNHDGTGTAYGAYIFTASSATTGNVYGIYTNGEDYNYFNGNIGVGTTTPTYPISVNRSTVLRGIEVITTNSSNFTYGIESTGTSTSSGTGRGIIATGVNNGTSAAYGVYATGNGTSSSTKYGVYGRAIGSGTRYGVFCSGNGGYSGTWTQISDERFKTNIRDAEPMLDKVLQLKPKKYKFIQNDVGTWMSLPEDDQIGLLSQELEQVFPELVSQDEHPGIEDENGEPQGAISYKGINYIGLTPILIKAIQEQQDIINKLEERIEELENQ